MKPSKSRSREKAHILEFLQTICEEVKGSQTAARRKRAYQEVIDFLEAERGRLLTRKSQPLPRK
jgi:hypothetical protein